MSGWKAWRDVPASERLERERALEPLSEAGFVVTSRELSRDGPWRIEIFGHGDKREVERAIDGQWRWETLPAIDWVAENQRSFVPFAVGPFWVHPSHAADGMPAGLLPIEIDAGLAFGTGQHATTAGCLAALDRLESAGKHFANVADIGTGTGLLAFAALALWPEAKCIATDIDPVAVDVARDNAAINRLKLGHAAGELLLTQADGMDSPMLAARAPFDLVIANILAGPLIELAPDFARAIAPGGTVVLAGLLDTQADGVIGAYAAQGLALEDRGFGEWPVLVCERRR